MVITHKLLMFIILIFLIVAIVTMEMVTSVHKWLGELITIQAWMQDYFTLKKHQIDGVLVDGPQMMNQFHIGGEYLTLLINKSVTLLMLYSMLKQLTL
jgi:hypothetical protein